MSSFTVRLPGNELVFYRYGFLPWDNECFSLSSLFIYIYIYITLVCVCVCVYTYTWSSHTYKRASALVRGVSLTTNIAAARVVSRSTKPVTTLNRVSL